MNITEGTKAFFTDLVVDSGNWSGQPLFGGNTADGPAEKGHLTHLKKLGLVTTDLDEGCTWVCFTAKATEYATEIGLGEYICW